MSHDSAPLDESILKLADSVFDGTASADDAQQLEAQLRGNPEIQKAYLRYAILNGQLSLTDPALSASAPASLKMETIGVSEGREVIKPPANRPRSRAALPWRIITVATTVAATILMALWLWPREPSSTEQAEQPNHEPESILAHYDDRSLPVDTVATVDSDPSGPTTLKNDRGEAQFASASGADVRLEETTMFGVSSPDGGVLFKGTVNARLNDPDSSFSVETANLRVVDLGTEFRVSHVDNQHVRVEVLDGEVEVQSRVRLPSYFFTFDSTDAEPGGDVDLISRASYVIGPATARASGLVGNGALTFNNSADAFVRVHGGTDTKVGKGRMACSSGISIEAMFVSHWTGKFGDYDEIFRKDDGVHRILLSFQNDKTRFAVPEVERGPCLSFGLHLEGHGYDELDMPLDGKQGRPRVEELCDGAPHHVVATYDSFTGRKKLSIDGRLCFEHEYPVGTLIISGGPVRAQIGSHRKVEPFNGVIDEVAFYDFALTQEEISAHHRNASAGQSYFGIPAEQLTSIRWKSLTRIQEGETRTFDKLTGLISKRLH